MDFERAFLKLESYGNPLKVQELYWDVRYVELSTIKIVEELIDVEAGVKQRCILFPLLFTIEIDRVMSDGHKNTACHPGITTIESVTCAKN